MSSERTLSRRWLGIAILVVVCVIFGVVATAAYLMSGPGGRSAATNSSISPRSSPQSSSSSPDGCGPSGGSSGVPSQQPADVHWSTVDGYWIPQSSSIGPARRSTTGAWTCFAHSPSGAVLAGWVIQSRLLGAKNLDDVVAHQLMPGPGSAQAAALIAGNKPTSAPIPLGFTVLSYSAAQATVSYASQQEGASVACTQQLQWYDGDWRQVVQQNGAITTGCTENPGGFTPWRVS